MLEQMLPGGKRCSHEARHSTAVTGMLHSIEEHALNGSRPRDEAVGDPVRNEASANGGPIQQEIRSRNPQGCCSPGSSSGTYPANWSAG